MNEEEIEAYEWARQQDYPSVAARYAKTLSVAVDGLQAQLSESQRREKAAVEWADKLCETMLYYNRDGYEKPIKIAGEYKERRGPQEDGKGE